VLVINNEATADAYTAATTLESKFGGRLVYVVANQSVVARFRPLPELAGSRTAEYGPEQVLTPQASFIDKISGAQFKSAIAGTPARIIASLSEPGDILPASGTPFTETLSASGALTVRDSYATARSAVNQSLANNTWTNLTFDTEELDTDGYFTVGNDFFRIPSTGTYLAMAGASIQQNATGRRIMRLQNDSTGIEIGRMFQPGSSLNENNIEAISRIFAATLNDVIRCAIFQDSGIALNSLAQVRLPFFSIVRIA
jgi:hypothetical protein